MRFRAVFKWKKVYHCTNFVPFRDENMEKNVELCKGNPQRRYVSEDFCYQFDWHTTRFIRLFSFNDYNNNEVRYPLWVADKFCAVWNLVREGRGKNNMSLYNKNGRKIPEITAEERLKVLLANAIGIYAEAHADRYNSSSEFWEFLYGDIGTDEEEMKELGIDLSDIL